jgi:hypothetical protein
MRQKQRHDSYGSVHELFNDIHDLCSSLMLLLSGKAKVCLAKNFKVHVNKYTLKHIRYEEWFLRHDQERQCLRILSSTWTIESNIYNIRFTYANVLSDVALSLSQINNELFDDVIVSPFIKKWWDFIEINVSNINASMSAENGNFKRY